MYTACEDGNRLGLGRKRACSEKHFSHITALMVHNVPFPKSVRYELSVTIFHYHIVLTSFSTATLSGGKVDLAVITAGVVVLVLLTLLGLTAGVTTGVVLGRRRAKRKGKAPKERGKSEERSNSIEVGGTIVNTFDIVTSVLMG